MSAISRAARRFAPGRTSLQAARSTAPVLLVTFLMAALIYAGQDIGLTPTLALRLICVVPVAMAAYRAEGILPGLALAAFFGSIFVTQDLVAWRGTGGTFSGAGAIIAGVLALVAYAASEITGSHLSRSAMGSALLDREALLARASDPGQLASFLLIRVRESARADHAALLWRDEATRHWWLTMEDERHLVDEGERPLSLARWLITQRGAQLLNALSLDVRFTGTLPDALLSQPINGRDGTLLAVLVAHNSESRGFTRNEAAALAQLAVPAGHALGQAGANAARERVAGRLAERLAAVGGAARQLNRTLEPRAITRATLGWALQVTGASIGFVKLQGGTGDRVVVSSQIPDGGAPALAALLEEAAGPARSPARPCLRAAIHRGDRAFGEVVVARADAEAFDAADEQALTALAEHAGIALENASLLSDVLRERSRARQIIENMADGLLATDESRRVTALNPAAEKLIGWDDAQAVGASACNVLGCENVESCRRECALRQAQITGEPSRRERWLAHLPGGGQRVLALNAAPLPPPSPGAMSPGLVVLLQDISEQEKMEQFQRELIAAFSHELRTPLASINTVVQLLLEQGAFGKDELSREHLELLRAQSRRLATFAERTLDVSRLERGQWALQQRPVPFPLKLYNAVARWQSIAARHPIHASGTEGGSLWAWADEEAVDTVLDNLIENAAKYSPDGGAIFLSATEGPAGFITVSVSDEGIGVDAEIRERIFDRFYRADASDTQRVYGHGLGLYIVRRLVEAMGGWVWVESTGGQGSRFVFTLHQKSRESYADPDH